MTQSKPAFFCVVPEPKFRLGVALCFSQLPPEPLFNAPNGKDADNTPKKMVGSDRLSPVCFGRGGGWRGVEECKQICREK